MKKQISALKVMVLDPKIRSFLFENDPQALNQAMDAIRDQEPDFKISFEDGEVEVYRKFQRLFPIQKQIIEENS